MCLKQIPHTADAGRNSAFPSTEVPFNGPFSFLLPPSNTLKAEEAGLELNLVEVMTKGASTT